MKTIKKIRFISFVTSLLTYLAINTNDIYAAYDLETYINSSIASRVIAVFLLISALISISIFTITTCYILVKE